MQTRTFSPSEALMIGNAIGVDWNQVDLEQFRMGLAVELEHGAHDPQTNVTSDDLIATGKIALAHLKELPDYYTRLAYMESGAGMTPAPGYAAGGSPGYASPQRPPAGAVYVRQDAVTSTFWTGVLAGVGVTMLVRWAFAKR